jgi:hypothetical protein
MMSKLMDEDVVGESIIGSHGAVEVKDAATAVSPIVCQHLDKLVGRKRRRFAQRVVVKREDVALRSKGVVGCANG